MSKFTTDHQWRSFQTFIATYLAGMLHPRDVFTISRSRAVMPPLVEYRCDADGRIWFSMGALAWSETTRDALGGIWALWAIGTLSDRSFALDWRRLR